MPRFWQLSSGIPLLGNCSFLTYQCSTWNLRTCFEIILLLQPPLTSKDISIESTSWEWASTPIKHGEIPCWHGTGHRKAGLVWGNWGLFQHLGSSKGSPWLLGCGHWVANRLDVLACAHPIGLRGHLGGGFIIRMSPYSGHLSSSSTIQAKPDKSQNFTIAVEFEIGFGAFNICAELTLAKPWYAVKKIWFFATTTAHPKQHLS